MDEFIFFKYAVLRNKMRISLPILLVFLLLIFHKPAWGYYKWYDENGVVHYTQADPPADAKNEDGSSWWGEEPDPEEKKSLREQKLQQIRAKIKSRDTHKPKPAIKPPRYVADADISGTEEEASVKEKKHVKNKSFFDRLVGIFFEKEIEEIEETEETEDVECLEIWLLEAHGICALDKPDMKVVGNMFKAEVIDNRKGVWSSCRGTYNGDILNFTYKGKGYWETDGNVPECPFYQGFYWK
jgi:hypothetical protein